MEFNKETAILTIMATGIATQVQVKDKDFHGNNSYAKRRNKKIREVLWEHPKEKVTLAIDLLDAIYCYEIAKDFDGLGGCKRKTLKECLENVTSEALTS